MSGIIISQNLTESSKFPAEQLFGVERRREADDFIRLTMEMKNDRTKSLETQGFRACRFCIYKNIWAKVFRPADRIRYRCRAEKLCDSSRVSEAHAWKKDKTSRYYCADIFGLYYKQFSIMRIMGTIHRCRFQKIKNFVFLKATSCIYY